MWNTWCSGCIVAMVLLAIYGHFRQFLGGCTSDAVRPKNVILSANVMSLNSAVMSHVMSQCHTCIGHMTFYYKRATDTLVGVLACCSSVHQVRLYHQRPACDWCLMHVGHDVSSTSPGWSLLPLTVIISTVSPSGILKYLYGTQECCSTPC